MAEFIEREKALNDFDEWIDTTGALPKGTSYYHECRACIEDVPAADVVEVVRCKDCKHSRTCADNDGEIMCVLNSEYNEDTGVDYGFVSYHSESHYCSYGERRPFK